MYLRKWATGHKISSEPTDRKELSEKRDVKQSTENLFHNSLSNEISPSLMLGHLFLHLLTPNIDAVLCPHLSNCQHLFLSKSRYCFSPQSTSHSLQSCTRYQRYQLKKILPEAKQLHDVSLTRTPLFVVVSS